MAKNKNDTPAPTPENRMVDPRMVRVRATRHIHEDGKTYAPDEEWELAEPRALGLGRNVTILTPPEETKPEA